MPPQLHDSREILASQSYYTGGWAVGTIMNHESEPEPEQAGEGIYRPPSNPQMQEQTSHASTSHKRLYTHIQSHIRRQQASVKKCNERNKE